MAIQAAIFDCDGTLLDSMPMWTDMCVALLERYGVKDAHRIFLEHESLDMDKKCFWYHDNLGIGESGEALYRELWCMVEEAYRTTVVPYEGCRALLDELRRRSIPCITLSSTPTMLLRQALSDHDLLGYFDELVFVGDVGRGKEFSDAYVAAGRRLGTPREDTWVFEDAPFGVRSAVRAGFPTVAIVNDHDGRDEDFMGQWATVVAHSYDELTVDGLNAPAPRITHATLVAGSPQPSSSALVGELCSSADFVVAVDRGIDALCEAKIVPDLYCGDADSASAEALQWARAAGVAFDRHPREKDDTDLGLAIACACREAERRKSALRLTVTCAAGGRPDHALGVYGLLAQHADVCPRLVEDGFECRLLAPAGESSWDLEQPAGTTVSIVALASGTVASESGMRWNLDAAELAVLGDLGISNYVVDTSARIICESGVLAAFVIAE